MNKKEVEAHLTEAKTALKDSVGMTTMDGAARFFLKSVANSLLVIAAVISDLEFKDENHVGCMEEGNNGKG